MADAKVDKKVKSIEDIIAGTNHQRYTDIGEGLKGAFYEARSDHFSTHYKNSLDAEKRKKFEGLDKEAQRAQMAHAQYKLPSEHADAFARDMALSFLKQLDYANEQLWKDKKGKDGKPIKPIKYSEAMEKAVKILKDKESTADEKAHALSVVEHQMNIVKQYIPKWDDMVETGKEHGFSSDLFAQYAGKVGELYSGLSKHFEVKSKVSAADARHYITNEIAKNKDLKGFNVEAAAHEKRDHDDLLKMVLGYAGLKATDAPDKYERFKKSHKVYFTEKKK
jgi:hypothetical protein